MTSGPRSSIADAPPAVATIRKTHSGVLGPDQPPACSSLETASVMVEGGTGTDTGRGDYVGDLAEGLPHGYGAFHWPDGRSYVGQWDQGQRHGYGVMRWPGGREYVGQWQGGLASGMATLSETNGARYTGEFQDSQRNGVGTQAYADGAIYTGGWKDNHPEGWGVVRTPDGKNVVGRSQINLRHGCGVHFFERGEADDNSRVYLEEGQLIAQSEWFARVQDQAFVEQCDRLGIPFQHGGGMSMQEKLYVLDGVTGNDLFDQPAMGDLALMAVACVCKMDVVQAACWEKGELAAALALGGEGVNNFCQDRGLPVSVRERLTLWSDWTRTEERMRVERFLRHRCADGDAG